MASSNRHWPSMFKSKPCNTHHHPHHQWQQHDDDDDDININPSLISSGCHRAPPYTSSSVAGCEERSPEPKPRWNPKPEQIRILEAIFNSGMVNPPREEIRKIRAQLQEYGQVGDANVFYWFQNRKSRSKHKQRHLQNSKQQQQPHQNPPTASTTTTTTATAAFTAPSSSSSSSSSSWEKSSRKSADKAFSVDVSNSPTASVNQTYFQNPAEFLPETPFFLPVQQAVFSQGFCFPELSNAVATDHQSVGNCSDFLLSDELMMNQESGKKVEDQKLKLQQELSYTVTTAPTATHPIAPPTALQSSINHILGAGAGAGVGESSSGAVGPAKSTVFINDVAFEVDVGPFNMRSAFGDDAVLIHSSGQPVITNEWGITLQPLHHGAFYYLVRTLTPITTA